MYKTELMEEILRSPMAQKIIQTVSPIYGEAYTVLWLYQAIGTILDKMDEWTGSLQDQVLPQTATWSIPYWEELYGITPDDSLSAEVRRANILKKYRRKSQINPKRMEDAISSISGYATEITENVAKNTFEILIRGYVEDLTEIKNAVREMKPAHLIYEIVMADLTRLDHETYGAMIMTERETYSLPIFVNNEAPNYVEEIYAATTLNDAGHVVSTISKESEPYLDASYSIDTDTGRLTAQNGTYTEFSIDQSGHLLLNVK